MSIPSIAGKLLALLFCAAFIHAARFYPFEKTWLLPILALHIGILCWRPAWWLGILPVLLPVLDLAPWTGWFFFEEIDFILLSTAACAYWHLAANKKQTRLPFAAAAGIAVMSCAYLAGTYRGLPAPAPLDMNAFSNYLSPYNSLRIAKAWLWALILLPPLMRSSPQRYLFPGMLAGLGLVSLAALWERAVFPGLSNLSSDYRTSAPFSGMHTGGAALDGYLALSLPFVALWLLTRQSRLKTGGALALLALGAHAGLTTFSRGLYAGLAGSAAIAGACLLASRIVLRELNWRRVLLGGLLAVLTVFALTHMFTSSGYRGLGAATVLLAAAFVLATLPIPRRLLPAALLCGAGVELLLALLLMAGAALASGIFKPPYFLFLASALAFAAGANPTRAGAARFSPGAIGIVLGAFFCLACNTLWIAYHWAGPAALGPAALVVALALALIAINFSTAAPIWRAGRASLTGLAAVATILLLTIPVCASYYATERFSSTSGDLRLRLLHWRQVLDMMDGNVPTSLFGMGLGTFPATYYWRNPLREIPGTLQYADQAGNRYLRLSAPGYNAGYGELLRLLQHVPLQAHTPYLLTFDLRRTQPLPLIQIMLCERLLLYPQNCVAAPLRLLPPGPDWQHYRLLLNSANLGGGAWPLRAPVQLEVAAAGGQGALDIDNISLRDMRDQHELIANGSFSKANNDWFFSSDRHHLPWHIKNFALNLYFEMGWLGLFAMSALLAFALSQLLARARRACPHALVYLASLCAFLLVGVFDSLLDVPRIALLFFLVLFSSMLRPAAPPTTTESPP